MSKYVLLFPILIVSALSACGQRSFDEKIESLYKNTVPLIQVDSLQENQENVVLLDTRAYEEYKVSHIAGAQFVDYDNFNLDQVAHIPKDEAIVVYCSVGYRSERIGEQLQEAGYTKVQNLYGGIFHWKNEGLEIVNNDEIPTDSVHTYNKQWGKWLYNGVKTY